jgi:hypothetical protein
MEDTSVKRGRKPASIEKGQRRIKNLLQAGKTVFGISGSAISFDIQGIAEVNNESDFSHFLQVPGYEEVV